MLVRFTTTENDKTTSPLILKASTRLARNIRGCALHRRENSNIHMVSGRELEEGKFEFVWAFGHFSIEQIVKEIDFPELLACEAHALPSGSRPSIIANVGRIVDTAPGADEDGEDDGRDEVIPF